MTPDDAGLHALRELIERGPEGAANAQPRPARGWLRRLALRLGQPNARHQQAINFAVLAELDRLAQTDAAAARTREALIQAQADLVERRGTLVQALDELREWLSNLQREQAEGRERLSEVAQLVPAALPLYGENTIPLELFDAGVGRSVLGFRQDAAADTLERAYVGFEDYFRGPEDAIKERQIPYLQLLEGHEPILDVGCGRGEILELLAERGIESRGVDVDPAMVKRCREKGLAVDLGDAVASLTEVEDASLGAIVALQVIEHLPYAELLAFLRTSRAKLRPGGRLIMETVNPHAPQALKHFWIDPTHQHPLFPEVVLALCALTGFASAYLWHAQGTGDPTDDSRQQPDYAVVATNTISRGDVIAPA